MRRRDNKGMNLDGRMTIILFEEVSTQKKVAEDFTMIFPKSRQYFKLAPNNMVRKVYKYPNHRRKRGPAKFSITRGGDTWRVLSAEKIS